MSENIIEGISVRLNELFGEEYGIYDEEVQQEREEPCFLLTELTARHIPYLGKRFKRERSFMIQYFPKDEMSPEKECRQVGEKILDDMEWIRVEGQLLRCTSMQYEIADGILNISFDCNRILRKTENEQAMQSQKADITAKEDEAK